MKGIISLEAMLVLISFFALISLLFNSLENTRLLAKEKQDLFSAKANSFKCAFAADSVYSNGIQEIKLNEKCFFEKDRIKSKKGKQESQEKTITKKISNSEKGLQIGVEDHYK